jgi:DNA-binding HxlR family transcriptional regulator
MKPDAEEFCAARDAIALLQGKWTLQIVRALLAEPRGFNDLARSVGGCNPATLSKRLDQLAESGIVSKRVDSTMPPRTCYSLTDSGAALERVIAAIEAWGEAYLPRR